MARKAAAGAGTIRKKAIIRNGKQYEYWEARYTVGYDPGTGKQIQRSVTGKTQKEVRQKLQQATTAIDSGTYKEPCKMTLGEWLDIWTAEYLGSVKPRTVDNYTAVIKNHLRPALGAVKLETLNAHTIQRFYNDLGKAHGGKDGLSPKSIKNVHGVLHKALQQAVKIGYLQFNPTEACELPRIERAELKPLDDEQIAAFLQAIDGHRYESLFTVTLFTGMRAGEVLGLQWDRVNFEDGTIAIDQQLQQGRVEGRDYQLVSTKNGKGRTVTPATFVMDILKHHRAEQAEQRLKAGALWEDGGFVFTDQLGHHLTYPSVYSSFKRVVARIGRPDARFHDLRHSYAVAAIRSGDDIKTVQGNLGHATAAFTLDVYGHVTNQMKKESAARMDRYIKSVIGQ